MDGGGYNFAINIQVYPKKFVATSKKNLRCKSEVSTYLIS